MAEQTDKEEQEYLDRLTIKDTDKHTRRPVNEWLNEFEYRPAIPGTIDGNGNQLVPLTVKERDSLISMAKKSNTEFEETLKNTLLHKAELEAKVERYEKALREIQNFKLKSDRLFCDHVKMIQAMVTEALEK